MPSDVLGGPRIAQISPPGWLVSQPRPEPGGDTETNRSWPGSSGSERVVAGSHRLSLIGLFVRFRMVVGFP